MLNLLNRIYGCICFLFQGKAAIKRVSYARDVLNAVARYSCKLFNLPGFLVLEAGTWECDVHQDGESLEFMQQVLYITPCLVFNAR